MPDSYWYYGDSREFVIESFDGVAPGSTIVDVGCGHSLLGGLLAGQHLVIGLDAAMTNVEVARSRSVVPVVADLAAPHLCVRDASVSAVLCSEVIEHLWNPAALLHEISRVLEPGGRLVLTTPNLYALDNRLRLVVGRPTYWLEHSTNFEHIRFWSVRSLRHYLELAGLEVRSIRGIGISSNDALISKALTALSLLRYFATSRPRRHARESARYRAVRLGVERRLTWRTATVAPALLAVAVKPA